MRVTFANGKITVDPGADQRVGTFRLDGSTSPKSIDILEDGETKPVLGIYEFDGKTLKLCMAGRVGTGRPTHFRTKQGTKLVLLIRAEAR